MLKYIGYFAVRWLSSACVFSKRIFPERLDLKEMCSALPCMLQVCCPRKSSTFSFFAIHYLAGTPSGSGKPEASDACCSSEGSGSSPTTDATAAAAAPKLQPGQGTGPWIQRQSGEIVFFVLSWGEMMRSRASNMCSPSIYALKIPHSSDCP